MRNLVRLTTSSLLACSLAAGVNAHAASYYYEATTRTEGESAGRGATANVRGWVDGSRAKVEYLDADSSGLFRAGSYLLTTDGGATLYLVNPAERAVSELELDAMFGMMGSVMNAMGGLVNMQFGDFVNERVEQRPGENILGYPTTFHHFNTGYTATMSVLGMRNESRSETRQQVWCADGLQADGFGIWLRPDRFRTGNTELDQLIAQEYGALDCVPLRMRSESTTSDRRGRPSTTTTVMEVTVLREESAPVSTFELPADYEHVSLLAGLPDELRELLEQSEQMEIEVPESGDSGRRPRLRDLLNR